MNEERSNGKGLVASEDRASIGKSILIKGELSGGEDLTIEGTVEGLSLIHISEPTRPY